MKAMAKLGWVCLLTAAGLQGRILSGGLEGRNRAESVQPCRVVLSNARRALNHTTRLEVCSWRSLNHPVETACLAALRDPPSHTTTTHARPHGPRSLDFSACLDGDTTKVSFTPAELAGTTPDFIASHPVDPEDNTKVSAAQQAAHGPKSTWR